MMKDMQKEYGKIKGKKVYYAVEAKQRSQGHMMDKKAMKKMMKG